MSKTTSMSIVNASTLLPNGQGGTWTTGQVLAQVVKSSAAKGITVGDMRVRLRLLDLLEKETETFELGRDQHTLLVRLFSEHQWPVMSPDILAIGDLLESAES